MRRENGPAPRLRKPLHGADGRLSPVGDSTSRAQPNPWISQAIVDTGAYLLMMSTRNNKKGLVIEIREKGVNDT